MNNIEFLSNIVINIFFVGVFSLYVIFLALSCSYTFAFMKNTCTSFDSIDRNNSSPEKYYHFFLGRSCANFILNLNRLCIILPALVIMVAGKKVIDTDCTKFIELLGNLQLQNYLYMSLLGFVVYFLILVHVLSFNRWLRKEQGESIFSLILETIVKKAI